MSDTYDINGVTVTPGNAGYYDLSHSSLAEPERVRGKENAEARAREIAAAAAPADGSMAPQPPLEAAAAAAEAPPATPSKDDARWAGMQAVVDQQREMIEKLMAAIPTTVLTDGTQVQGDPLATMPREYTGQVDAKTKAAAKKLGIEYVTIILEESGDIPPTGLFIGHNGNSFMIMPGEPVDVPDFLLNVLDDAVMSSPTTDSKSQKILGYRNRSRFPYRVVNHKDVAKAA